MANTPDSPQAERTVISEDSHHSSESIKAVAIYEIVKGVGALLGAAALVLWHNDLEHWLASANDSWRRYFGTLLAPQVESTIQIAQQASQNWTLFLLFIVFYVSLRFIEAYGLWQDKTWAYWFSVIGYGIFIPVEIYYLVISPFDWFKLSILILNVIIVIVVYRSMRQKGLL
nr:DUF2127 domain-containing protein [uncultured Psychrobacter sp.]